MLDSQVPPRFPIKFGSSAPAANIRAIPTASQIGVTPGAASLADGFPPVTFMPIGAGGIPPFGQDMNGILNQLSAWAQWQAAGGAARYDQAFAYSIGGYPKGAILLSPTLPGTLWLNLIDNNTGNPDQGASGWQGLLFPYAKTDSPHFTGIPTAPTAAASDNSTQLATTAYAQPRLPFVPVQQGTGAAQLPNTVKLGWSSIGLKAMVDATDLGHVWTDLATSGGFATPGFIKFPNGFIIQWGTALINLNGTVFFPTAFPSACLGVVVSEGAASSINWGVGSPTIHAAGTRTATNYVGWALGWVAPSSSWTGGQAITQNYIAVGI